jgi:hypothetical protein
MSCLFHAPSSGAEFSSLISLRIINNHSCITEQVHKFFHLTRKNSRKERYRLFYIGKLPATFTHVYYIFKMSFMVLLN